MASLPLPWGRIRQAAEGRETSRKPTSTNAPLVSRCNLHLKVCGHLLIRVCPWVEWH